MSRPPGPSPAAPVGRETYSYDRVAYVTEPSARTGPAHLSGLAALYGLRCPLPSRSRILELGCGSGNNLIALAALYPEAELAGIDMAQAAISEAKITAAELQLKNISFEQCDLRNFSQTGGKFDYIIAHGLYSWVPPEIQQAILQLIKSQLSDNGCAFISFNSLPGWYLRGIFREIALFHIRDDTDPGARLRRAREILDGLLRYARSEDGFDIELLRHELRQILAMPDWFLFHDLLEQQNQPRYFAEFIEHIHQNGLRYVADAEPQKNEPLEFSEEARSFIASITDERYGFEQYTDFFRLRMFRRAIVCHDSAELAMPDKNRLQSCGLFVATPLKLLRDGAPGEAVRYQAPNGGGLVIPQRWLQALINQLISAWPQSLALDELLTSVAYNPELQAQAAKTFLDGYFAGVFEFTREPVPAAESTESPAVFAPARLFARRGLSRVGNIRHEMVQLPPAVAALLPRLDGTRTAAQLEEDFTAFQPLLSAEDLKLFGSLSQVLDFLKQNSLIL